MGLWSYRNYRFGTPIAWYSHRLPNSEDAPNNWSRRREWRLLSSQLTPPYGAEPTSGRLRRILLVAVRPAEGRLIERTPAVRPKWRGLLFMPHPCRSQYPSGSAQSGGRCSVRFKLPFSLPGVGMIKTGTIYRSVVSIMPIEGGAAV